MTGPLERPSQETSETRTARTQTDILRAGRTAISALLAAEMQVLVAAQRALRRQVFAAIDAALSDLHAGRTLAVLSRFAGRRAALHQAGDPTGIQSALARIGAEEAAELAVLALELAAEKRRRRDDAIAPLLTVQRDARLSLRRSHGRQRAVAAIRLQSLRPRSRLALAAPPRLRPRARVSRFVLATRL